MTFKEQIEQDNRAVFMNLDEFSEIDNNEMIDREKRHQYKRDTYADGVYRKELLIYVKAEDFGKLPAVGRLLNLDGKSYIISDAIDEDGIYSLSLEANKSGGRV